MKAKLYFCGAFHPVDADLAVTLRGVSVACGEKCSGIQDRKVEPGARRKITDVHVSTEDSGRPRAELAVLVGRDAHHAAERAKWNNRGRERIRNVPFELPMKKVRLVETAPEKSEAADDAWPGPTFVGD